MNDTQEPTADQKKENIIEALKYIGFTENPDNRGMYSQDREDIRTVVDLTAGCHTYLYDTVKRTKIDGDVDGLLADIDQIIEDAIDGKMPTKVDVDEVVNIPKKSDPAKVPESPEPLGAEPVGTTTNNVPAVSEPAQACAPQVMPELSIEIIKKYINEKVTDEEAYRFIQLCKARHLNPFLGQVHLIKKEFTGTAKTIVGKDVFMERAARHPQYDGFEAGIIIKVKGKNTTEDRPGAFLDDSETLVGGWAKVHRKDQKHCTEARVSMKEYNTGKASWKNIPATMIRKVPLVQAQREAFAAELSGMYDSSEMGVEIE